MSCRHRQAKFLEAMQSDTIVWHDWPAENTVVDETCERCVFVAKVVEKEMKERESQSKERGSAFRFIIEIVAKRRLLNSGFGWPDQRIVLLEHESAVIVAIHCHNGPYTYYRQSHGTSATWTVPRFWLVECGALEAMPEEKKRATEDKARYDAWAATLKNAGRSNGSKPKGVTR